MRIDSVLPRFRVSSRLRAFAAAVVLAWGMFSLACAPVQLVADHSSEAEKAITDVSASVFAMYDHLIDQKLKRTPEAPLPYAGCSEDWGRVESQLRLIVMREGSRPLNSESTRITESILRMWQKFREAHRSTDDYKLGKMRIDLDHLTRNLGAALAAEKGKLLANPDTPPASDH